MFLVVLNLFTLICLGSPHYWPRSLHLLCSNFLPKATALYIWLFSWDSQAVQQWEWWGARTEEPHPWDRLLACFMSTSVWDTWHRYQRVFAPEKCRFHFSNFTLSELPWWDQGCYTLLENDLGDRARRSRSWVFLPKLEGSLVLVLLGLVNQRACLSSGCARESRCF